MLMDNGRRIPLSVMTVGIFEKCVISNGINIKIDWFYEEGDDKMMEDGEDLAEAIELKFNYIESVN